MEEDPHRRGDWSIFFLVRLGGPNDGEGKPITFCGLAHPNLASTADSPGYSVPNARGLPQLASTSASIAAQRQPVRRTVKREVGRRRLSGFPLPPSSPVRGEKARAFTTFSTEQKRAPAEASAHHFASFLEANPGDRPNRLIGSTRLHMCRPR